jgi:hypothetical protein
MQGRARCPYYSPDPTTHLTAETKCLNHLTISSPDQHNILRTDDIGSPLTVQWYHSFGSQTYWDTHLLPLCHDGHGSGFPSECFLYSVFGACLKAWRVLSLTMLLYMASGTNIHDIKLHTTGFSPSLQMLLWMAQSLG